MTKYLTFSHFSCIVCGCVKKEGKIMKVYAIRNYGTVSPSAPKNKTGHKNYQTNLLNSEPKQDSVSFKSKTLKGIGIGGIAGLVTMGALSVLTGGLATPLAFGVYAGAMGAAGGLVGNALDDIDRKEKESQERAKKK